MSPDQPEALSRSGRASPTHGVDLSAVSQSLATPSAKKSGKRPAKDVAGPSWFVRGGNAGASSSAVEQQRGKQ